MPPIFWTQKQDIGPSQRVGHGLAYDAARQQVVLFGGDPGLAPLADTWTWDGAHWTQVGDIGPTGRHGHAMAFDAARGRVVLVGGAAGTTFRDDTWTWDGTEWTQVADTGPDGRAGHALAYDATRQRIVLFGGRSAAGSLGDTWLWDGTEWTQAEDVGPSARRGHAMAFDAAGDRILLFGGAGADGDGLGDTWAWDGTTWSQLTDTGPEARVETAMVGSGGATLFGGVSSIDPAMPPADRVFYGDSWSWDGTFWTKVQDIGPGPRRGHAVAYRAAAGRLVLLGGATVVAPPQDTALIPGLLADTWEVAVGSGGADPDPNPDPGPDPGTTAEVAIVSVEPQTVGGEGEVLDVVVELTQPTEAGATLMAMIFFDPGGGNYQPQEPPGFTLPDSPTVPPGEIATTFQVVRDATPLTPGQYAIGVTVIGSETIQGAFFEIV